MRGQRESTWVRNLFVQLAVFNSKRGNEHAFVCRNNICVENAQERAERYMLNALSWRNNRRETVLDILTGPWKGLHIFLLNRGLRVTSAPPYLITFTKRKKERTKHLYYKFQFFFGPDYKERSSRSRLFCVILKVILNNILIELNQNNNTVLPMKQILLSTCFNIAGLWRHKINCVFQHHSEQRRRRKRNGAGTVENY